MSKRQGSKTMKRPPVKKTTAVRKIARQEAKKAVITKTERKYYDTTAIGSGIDFSGTNAVFSMTTNPLTATSITQGTDDVQYIGKKITPIYVHIRGRIAAVDGINVMRCIVVQTKTNNVPTLAGILQSVGNVRAPYAAYERQFNDQWNILVDRTYIMDGVNAVSLLFSVKISGKRLRKIAFTNSTGTIEKGAIYMCWVSDSGVTPHPTMEYYARLTYTDA